MLKSFGKSITSQTIEQAKQLWLPNGSYFEIAGSRTWRGILGSFHRFFSTYRKSFQEKENAEVQCSALQ